MIIQGLVKDGAGESAGLKEGDVILSIDGKDLDAPNELQTYVATRHPGDIVSLKVFRDGRVLEKKLTLKARDEETTTQRASDRKENEEKESPEESSVIKFDQLGMSIRSMSTDEKKGADVESGVVVTDVRPYGEAFSRGVASNDVIVEADRKEIRSPGDMEKIIKSHKPGDSILLRVKRQNGSSAFVAVQLPEK